MARIVIIEDDRDDREMFEEAIREVMPGVVIESVHDGKQVTEYLAACGPDDLPCCIILDYNMPNMNGPQVLDWICGQPKFNGIDKFIWSTAFQQEYVDGCLRKGAIQYFIKPNNMDGIIDIARKIVEHCVK